MTPWTEDSAKSLADVVKSSSVIVCMGPGGVGKTTSAAALGIGAAQLGLRVVVLTVDPAKRLAEAMGLSDSETDDKSQPDGAPSDNRSERGLGSSGGLGNDPRQIPGSWRGELWGVMLDPQATFDSLIADHARSDKQRRTILANRLYRNLTTTLTGTNEYMAAERLRSLHLDDRFDLVVLDTPPAHHALDLLDSPGRLSRFFDHRVYRTILAPKPGVFRAVTSAANLVVRAIGQVVGSTLLADAIEFFNEFQGMDRGFRDRAAEIDGVLRSKKTAYILVSSSRYEPLAAGRWITKQLIERGRRVDVLILNRITPMFWPLDDMSRWEGLQGPLVQNLSEMASLRRSEEALLYEALATGELGRPKVLLLEEQADPVTDLAALARLAKKLMTAG